jgi:hypothetical protein
MTRITRRSLLGGVAATSIPLPAVASLPRVQGPEERLQAAIEELQAAASVAIPSVKRWRICIWIRGLRIADDAGLVDKLRRNNIFRRDRFYVGNDLWARFFIDPKPHDPEHGCPLIVTAFTF